MKKNVIRMSVGIGLLLAVISLPARADFYIGVRGGLSNQNVKADEIKFDKDSSFLYGGQIGFKFLSFAVEGEFYRADHDLLSDDPEFPEPQEMDYYYLGINGKLGIPLVVVYPYVTVGYGTYTANLKDIGKDSDRAFNIGAGAELTVGKVGVFAEIRYNDFSVDISGQTWDFGGLDLHFGLNIHF